MGGFVNGSLGRVPGTRFICTRCKRELDESEFNFQPSKGYYAKCYPCQAKAQREYQRDKKEREKMGLVFKRHTVSEKDIVPDAVGIETVKQNVRNGDVYRYKKQIIEVNAIHPGYVDCFVNGKREGMLWIDMHEIFRKGKLVRRNEKSKEQEPKSGNGSRKQKTATM